MVQLLYSQHLVHITAGIRTLLKHQHHARHHIKWSRSPDIVRGRGIQRDDGSLPCATAVSRHHSRVDTGPSLLFGVPPHEGNSVHHLFHDRVCRHHFLVRPSSDSVLESGSVLHGPVGGLCALDDGRGLFGAKCNADLQ